MKLEKFKEKDHRKKITIGISIVLVLLIAGIIIYRSFAFYEEKKAFDVIKGQVPDQDYDLMFSFYIKDENDNLIYQETMPEGTNYSVSVTCSDGATGEWDYEAWGPLITNLTSTRTKCKIYFKEEKIQVGDYVSYTPSKTSYTTSTSYTGYTKTQTINPSELNLWRVIQITNEGIELVSEYTSSVSIYFYGKNGYRNFVGYLNVLASQYETEKITVGSRYLGYNGQTEYITDTSIWNNTSSLPWTGSIDYNSAAVESKGGGDTFYTKDIDLIRNSLDSVIASPVRSTTADSYFLASRYYYAGSSGAHWFNNLRYVNSTGGITLTPWVYVCNFPNNKFDEQASSAHLRPIVVLKNGLQLNGDGTKDNPWKVN